MFKTKMGFKLLLFAAVFLTIPAYLKAQIYVEIRPVVPVMVRPPQPGSAYIWVNEEWEPDGRSYRYSGGRWIKPPQLGYYYHNGYWLRTKKGQKWIKGSWSSKKHGNNGNHYGQKKHKRKH